MEDYVVGNKEVFAIEFNNVCKYENYVYGKIFYWIQGIKLGKNEECIIGDAIHSIKWMVFDNGNRQHELFYTLDKNKVFSYLSGRAYYDDLDKFQEKANLESWGRFDIAIDLPTLCNLYIFYIEGNKKSRIIYSSEDEKIDEAYIENGYVEKVILEVNSLLNHFLDE